MRDVQTIEKKSKPRRLYLWYLPVLVVVVLVLFSMRKEIVPLLDYLHTLVDRAGPYGPAIFIVGAGAWATLLLPGPLIMGLAATMYASRPLFALALISAGFAIAQAVAFTLSRFLLRDIVLQKVGNQAWFLWLEEQVKERGAVAVFVIRTLPFFPNSLANYGFGLTNIGFFRYLVASWAGTLPMISFYIFGTAGLVHLLKGG